jgi:hypothetical protein
MVAMSTMTEDVPATTNAPKYPRAVFERMQWLRDVESTSRGIVLRIVDTVFFASMMPGSFTLGVTKVPEY